MIEATASDMLVAKTTSFSHHFNAVIFQLTETENEPCQLTGTKTESSHSKTLEQKLE